MKTFGEVLKKHFADLGNKYTATNVYSHSQVLGWDDSATVTIKAAPLPYGDTIELQSFTSPEKLDQFLTLLFE
jgi:hypothetical protein